MSIFDFNSPSYAAQLVQHERQRMMWEMAARSPLAQAKVSNVRDPLGPPTSDPLLAGIRVIERDLVPDGEIYLVDGSTLVLQRYNRYGERTGVQAITRTPFYTRHMLGVREAARAKRRARKGLR
jgi:hypothetical protein